ncbi:hypothetical protein PanWU01x14_094620, partial [Parasponia andersonii]
DWGFKNVEPQPQYHGVTTPMQRGYDPIFVRPQPHFLGVAALIPWGCSAKLAASQRHILAP